MTPGEVSQLLDIANQVAKNFVWFLLVMVGVSMFRHFG